MYLVGEQWYTEDRGTGPPNRAEMLVSQHGNHVLYSLMAAIGHSDLVMVVTAICHY